MTPHPRTPSVVVRLAVWEEVIAMNVLYVIVWSVIALLLLPVLAFVIFALGPAAFVFLLIAAFAAPLVLLAGGIMRR
jgi:hypothetical protein